MQQTAKICPYLQKSSLSRRGYFLNNLNPPEIRKYPDILGRLHVPISSSVQAENDEVFVFSFRLLNYSVWLSDTLLVDWSSLVKLGRVLTGRASRIQSKNTCFNSMARNDFIHY